MKLDAATVQEMLANDPYMLLVDVRTREEFDAGHIRGAGCMPVEEITDCLYDEALGERGLDLLANARGMELSDDASVIVLYCQTGARSAVALQHMEAIGYVNVYDACGLDEWPFDIVTTAEEVAAGGTILSAEADASCDCGHDHVHEGAHGHAHEHGADHGHEDGHSCGCGCA